VYGINNYELPSDIKRHVRYTLAKKLLIFFAVLVFCATVMWYYRADIFPFWLTWRRGILFTVLVISPFASTRVPFCFIDSNWRGKIIDVEYYTEFRIGTGGSIRYAPGKQATAKRGINSRYTVAVTAKREDGSIKKVKVSTFGGTTSEYKVGDSVIHFKGLKNLLIISAQDDGFLNCVVCGCNNPKTRDNCFGCGHTLLKEYDI
jgi:hypothetical protein